MISFIMRERFGLRVTPERRKAVLADADKALANWSIKLPDAARMSQTDMDSWPTLLHLTYNNFLILLHRPHPRASAYSDDYGPNDAEICSAAAGVIVSIFEELRDKDRIKYLWSSAVNALFTAMIQIRIELRFSNPVLAINALRRFDSTLASLRSLAEYWHNAETILRLFESSKRLKDDMEMVKMKEQFSANKPDPGENAIPKFPDDSATKIDMPLPQSQNWWSRPELNDRLNNYFNKQDSTGAVPVDDALQQQPDPTSDQGDWRQLFSFADSERCSAFGTENLNDMEDEWRELYLHDPGLSDYFPESSWL